jgi:hypothetical protein
MAALGPVPMEEFVAGWPLHRKLFVARRRAQGRPR